VDHERSAYTLASDELVGSDLLLGLTTAICTAATATSSWKNPADADLIAHAAGDIAALIAGVERLRGTDPEMAMMW